MHNLFFSWTKAVKMLLGGMWLMEMENVCVWVLITVCDTSSSFVMIAAFPSNKWKWECSKCTFLIWAKQKNETHWGHRAGWNISDRARKQRALLHFEQFLQSRGEFSKLLWTHLNDCEVLNVREFCISAKISN